MRWRLSLVLLLALGGCATYYDEKWTDTVGRDSRARDDFGWMSDAGDCGAWRGTDDSGDPVPLATPEIIACMKKRGWTYTLTARHESLFSRP